MRFILYALYITRIVKEFIAGVLVFAYFFLKKASLVERNSSQNALQLLSQRKKICSTATHLFSRYVRLVPVRRSVPDELGWRTTAQSRMSKLLGKFFDVCKNR